MDSNRKLIRKSFNLYSDHNHKNINFVKYSKLLPFLGNETYICMNVDFKSNKLRKQLTSPSEIKKAFGVNAKRVSQRMEDINASDNLQVLCNIPQANCHALSGDKAGEWAVDISANHRILFIITNDPIPVNEDGGIVRMLVTDIQIISAQEDYH